jgi:hypothetical protein
MPGLYTLFQYQYIKCDNIIYVISNKTFAWGKMGKKQLSLRLNIEKRYLQYNTTLCGTQHESAGR